MGVGLDQMLNKVSSSSSSSRAEDDEELGEYSDHHDSNCSSSDEDSPASPPNPSSACHVPPASQLPIKRGLSKFYQGKSQSFSSFSDVRCVEDLAKKAHPIRRKMMKPSMSCGDGLLHVETNNSCCDGNSMIDDQNKVPRVSSCASSIARTSAARNCKPPPIPMHK